MKYFKINQQISYEHYLLIFSQFPLSQLIILIRNQRHEIYYYITIINLLFKECLLVKNYCLSVYYLFVYQLEYFILNRLTIIFKSKIPIYFKSFKYFDFLEGVYFAIIKKFELFIFIIPLIFFLLFFFLPIFFIILISSISQPFIFAFFWQIKSYLISSFKLLSIFIVLSPFIFAFIAIFPVLIILYLILHFIIQIHFNYHDFIFIV